jgi:hypothetical protein
MKAQAAGSSGVFDQYKDHLVPRPPFDHASLVHAHDLLGKCRAVARSCVTYSKPSERSCIRRSSRLRVSGRIDTSGMGNERDGKKVIAPTASMPSDASRIDDERPAEEH